MTPIRQLFRTTAFRLSALYVGLFAVSVAALGAFLYLATDVVIRGQIDDTIAVEIAGLAEQYERAGLTGLGTVIAERSRDDRLGLYLLVTPGGARIAGNLDSWPDESSSDLTTAPGGWIDFPYRRRIEGVVQTRAARARHFVLPGGFELLVGRDVQLLFEFERLVRRALAWAVALTLGLGLAGGAVLSRNVIRRIQAINRTSRDIMAGDLSRRLPRGGGGDELDRLAENVNAMLERIERLMAGLREVSDNIAHDLRSPLSRLRARIEVTLLQKTDEAGYRAALESMIGDVESILATFDALLRIAQAEAGVLQDRRPVDLGRLAADIGELYGASAEGGDLVLEVETGEGLVIAGDRDLLAQAVSNLLDNAVKYTPAGGRVTLTARRDRAEVVLAVRDTGRGVPANEHEHVLDRFVRLEASRHTPGSGLGLSLVRAIARLHGARLELEDAAPGLVVRLIFPAAARTGNLAQM